MAPESSGLSPGLRLSKRQDCRALASINGTQHDHLGNGNGHRGAGEPGDGSCVLLGLLVPLESFQALPITGLVFWQGGLLAVDVDACGTFVPRQQPSRDTHSNLAPMQARDRMS